MYTRTCIMYNIIPTYRYIECACYENVYFTVKSNCYDPTCERKILFLSFYSRCIIGIHALQKYVISECVLFVIRHAPTVYKLCTERSFTTVLHDYVHDFSLARAARVKNI